MTGTNSVKGTSPRGEYWREQISAQKHSGLSVQQFCEAQGINGASFYVWRKRLQKQEPVRFALVETGTEKRKAGAEYTLELVLPRGERLRIGCSVNATVLRTVLEALRR
jgi:hypothetical protein